MSVEEKNIYREERERLQMTRAEAAKRSKGKITEGRIRRIEDDPSTANPEDVAVLADVYECKRLFSHYCSHKCEIGKRKRGGYKADYTDNIYEILTKMIVTLNVLNKNKDRLMKILEDGKIEDEEKNEFAFIQEHMRKISSSIEAMELWCQSSINQAKK